MFSELRPAVERELGERHERAREAHEHIREHQHEFRRCAAQRCSGDMFWLAGILALIFWLIGNAWPLAFFAGTIVLDREQQQATPQPRPRPRPRSYRAARPDDGLPPYMRAYRFHQQQQQFAAAPPVVENTGLTPMKRAQLMRVLGMLGSAHPGERDNAARLAERIRRAAGLTWEQLIRGGKDEPRHRPHATEREKW